MKKIIVVIGLLILILHSSVRLSNAQANNRPLWLRNTAISPNGQQIAFTYKGDAYLVPSTGGRAQVLAQAHDSGYIADLHWSPDGSTIALSINKLGNTDVFTVPSKGGSLTRLTWHPGKEIPLGFSDDGKSVLISTPHYASPRHTQFSIVTLRQMQHQVFSVPASGGKLQSVLPLPVYQARISPDGTKVAYAGVAVLEQRYRKHQKSAASSSIMIFDKKSGKSTQITKDRISALEPNWSPEGDDIFYLSETSGDFNVWKYNLKQRSAQQITDHASHPVRNLSIANDGTLVYSYDGEIYLRKKGAQTSKRVDIHIAGTTLALEFTIAGLPVTDFDVSPTAPEAIVNGWGDLFLVDLTSGKTRELVRSGYEERAPLFTPDGKGIIFASERSGNWGIYKAFPGDDAGSFIAAENYKTVPIIVGDFDAFQPLLSPDGSKLAYLQNRTALHVLDLESGSNVVISPAENNYSYTDGDINFSWSPDSKFLALENQETIFNTEIVIFPVEGKNPPIWVTRNDANETVLGWATDGGSIFYASALLAPFGADGERSSLDVFQTFLSRAAKQASEQDPSATPDDDSQAEGSSQNSEIDYNSIEKDRFQLLTRRITRQTTQLLFGSPVLGGQGVLQVSLATKIDGSKSFIGVLTNLTNDSVSTVFEVPPQRNFHVKVTNDGSGIWFTENNTLSHVDLLNPNNNYSLPFNLKFNLPLEEYILASFDQYWTITKKKLFDQKMNGVDWDFYGTAYRRFLPHINDGEDMAIILSEMAGELNVSHTSGSYTNPLEQAFMGSLGVLYNHEYSGSGMQIGEIILGGPLDRTDVKARPGDVIIAIDGTPVPDRGGVNRLLMDRGGASVVVRFLRPKDNSQWTKSITTVEYQEEDELLKERWRAKNRDYVIKASKGRLGYSHLAAMGETEYRKFTAEVLGNFRRAEGLIVDDRFNLGGNLHDSLVTFLSGKKYLQWGDSSEPNSTYESRSRWYAPSLILANASSYSDGSVFPQSYKNLKIGMQVGEGVPGTGTAVWWIPSNIIPGLVYGIPQLPLIQVDGTYLENHEILPDVHSINDLESIIAGRDKQLEDAVAAMLDTIKETSINSPQH